MPWLLLIIALVTPWVSGLHCCGCSAGSTACSEHHLAILGFISCRRRCLVQRGGALVHGVWDAVQHAILVVAMLIDLSPAAGRRRREN